MPPNVGLEFVEYGDNDGEEDGGIQFTMDDDTDDEGPEDEDPKDKKSKKKK